MKGDKYTKLTQREHVLIKPNMWVGEISISTTAKLVTLCNERGKVVQDDLCFSAGFLKIFDEILVNSVDNAVDSCNSKQKMSYLRVNITKQDDTCIVQVMNDGNTVPIEIHQKEKIYVPELIFGHLMTSSNYDENEERLKGGTHGLGAKLTNIFSSMFEVHIENSDNKMIYTQRWLNNMETCQEPEIKKQAVTKNMTSITFIPDRARFFDKKHLEEHLDLLRGRLYEISFLLAKYGVKTYLNDQEIKIKSFIDFLTLLDETNADMVHLGSKQPRWDVYAKVTKTPKSISFVNSVNTYDHGIHCDAIVNMFVELLRKQLKNDSITSGQIKKYLQLAVDVTVPNPSFDAQSKNKLVKISEKTTKLDKFYEFTGTKVKEICVQLKELMADLVSTNELANINKELNKSRKRGLKIPKLTDAHFAGTARSAECTLIVTEGDSASQLAIAGLQVVGQDTYGVFPLKGKLLNTLKASMAKIVDNEEIKNLLLILGIDITDPNNAKTLRYGSLMIMADQDLDGYHIKGLVSVFMYTFCKSFTTKKGGLKYFITPIIKAKKGKEVREFFNLNTYHEWYEQEQVKTGWTIKYYKGLGTSTEAEAKQYFSNLDKHVKFLVFTGEQSDEAVSLAFDEKRADDRKQWIENALPREITEQVVPFETFVHAELVEFSLYDCQRSIPSLIDGLKPSQRKILYVCLLQQPKEIKVSQLSGIVSAETEYLHGEVSLNMTIVNMAQTFTGSNNLNILTPIGAFGSRRNGGEAASARYIFTRLNPIMNLIFRKEDLPVLEYQVVEGKKVEPVHFAPIIPLLLINGSVGIGTGYSTKIPMFNPIRVIQTIRQLLNKQPLSNQMIYYQGFKGTLTPQNGKIAIRGVVETGKKIIVTEIPIDKSFIKYEESLRDMITKELIDDYKSDTKNESVRIEIIGPKFAINTMEQLIKNLGLLSSMPLTNFTAFNEQKRLICYNDPNQMLVEYARYRLKLYEKRRQYELNAIIQHLLRENAKRQFIIDFRSKKIQLFDKRNAEIEQQMITLKYPKINDSYQYLLGMSLSSLSVEKVQELEAAIAKLEQRKQFLETATPTSLWLLELDELEQYVRGNSDIDQLDLCLTS